jgi:hypothetical protein
MVADEVQVLLRAVDFSGCSGFFDPFAGSHTVSRAFSGHGIPVVENDIDPFWNCATTVDALQPCSYDWLRPQVVVTSPPFDLLDLVAPLLACKAGAVACVHVPGHWLASPRVARQAWLSAMSGSGQAPCDHGLAKGGGGEKVCLGTHICIALHSAADAAGLSSLTVHAVRGSLIRVSLPGPL